MKSLYILLIIILNSLCSTAQQKFAFHKRTSVITLGYGVGNIWKQFLEEGISSPESYSVSSSGPIAFTYEYGFFNRISAGFIVGYSLLKGKFTSNQVPFEDRLTCFSLLARANYHFLPRKKLDLYAGGGLGYYNFKYQAKDGTGAPFTLNNRIPGTFGYSVQVGIRYYFSNNIGAYAELGYLGGSLAQFGIAFSFR